MRDSFLGDTRTLQKKINPANSQAFKGGGQLEDIGWTTNFVPKYVKNR